MNEIPKLSMRCRPGNADHHLFNNNGTWWIHFTILLPDSTKQRVRLSLRTHRVEAARELRDRLLSSFRDFSANLLNPI
jgi:hypothetical protein